VSPRIYLRKTDLLCENCGYRLNGFERDLQLSGVRPAGVAKARPTAPAADAPADVSVRGYFRTAMQVILSPSRFYRNLTTRGSVKSARWFGWFFYILTVAIFEFTLVVHLGMSITSGRWLGMDRIFDQFVSKPLEMPMIHDGRHLLRVSAAHFVFADGRHGHDWRRNSPRGKRP